MHQKILPVNKISGCIKLPGDKSISHRALMIASIAEGTSEIENLSDGADVQSTANCLKQLGVKIKRKKNITTVSGRGLNGFKPPAMNLDVGNSGTTIRLLSGLLAGQQFTSTITGDDSIQRRPMSRIVKPLTEMGTEIHAVNDEYAPLRINGGNLSPIVYRLPMASAQVKSSILFAGLYANGINEIIEPYQTRDHTERMLQNFGAAIEKEGLKVSVSGPAKLKAQNVFVPGDLSSAAFFIAAAILVKDSDLKIENVGINPTRKAFLSILSEMQANIDIINLANFNNELMADIFVRHSTLKSVKIERSMIPQIIDEIPILAVLATQAEGTTEIRGAGELRYKESDRLQAVTTNLIKMGANVEQTGDDLIINGPVELKHFECDSFNDHRIAMSFTIAALIAKKTSLIKNALCANVSFPGFYEKLKEVIVN